MVSKTTPADAAETTPSEDSQSLVIEDSTPEDVVAQERQFFGEEPDETPQPEESKAEAVAEPAAAVAPSPTESPEEAAPQPEPEQPRQRVYSQEEYSKLQSALRKQAEEADKRAREAEERLQRFDLDKEVEAELRRQEARWEPAVGSEEARRTVRDPQNVESVRQLVNDRAEVQRAKREAETVRYQSRANQMAGWIRQLQTQHSLSDDDAGVLAGFITNDVIANDQTFMAVGEHLGVVAQRLGSASARKAETSKAVKAAVPPETPETALESGRSTTTAPANDDARADEILNKRPQDWSDEEYAFMSRRNR